MPCRKIKLSILIICYCNFLLLLSSETLISDFQKARRNLIVASENTSETLFISIKEWKTISDQKEFQYKGAFYDAKSIVHQKNRVKISVVKDEFEQTIASLSKQIHTKNKKSQSISGKKNIVLYYYPSEAKTKTIKSTTRNHFRIYTNFYKPNYSLFLFRPPTSI